MKKSFVIIAFCVASFTSINANAVDMFNFEDSEAGLAQRPNGNLSTTPKAFTAKLNSAALERETVVFNLPHKQVTAIRKSKVGQVEDQIIPYGFKGQKGFAAVNFKNNQLDSLLIFDEEAAEVFRGNPLADGSIVFTQVDIDSLICVNFKEEDNNASLQTADISYYQSLTNLSFGQVTSLQSRPGASKVLYIDYLAGSVSGTAWNAGDGDPATIIYANYSYDGDPSTFSLLDLQSMYAGWAEAAEDYAPFNINVTTDLSVFNAAAQINKSKIIATSTNWRGSGGVAYRGGFGIRNDDFWSIGWTFNKGFGSMGMTNSHESGHQMGLRHDGLGDGIGSNAYYSGAGNSGPIMGAPFGKDFVHWNEGTYPNANQSENDVSIIQGKLGLVADDHGNTNGTASALSSQELVGFIRPAGLSADVDVFSFTLASNEAVDLTVRSLFAQANNSGGDNTAGGLNLSAKIELRNSSNNLIQQKLPTSTAAANDFNYSGSLNAGTYYLSIQAQVYSGANFNQYGNGGYYQILNNLDFSTAPDLVVESPTVNDATLNSGQGFQFSATVKNQGDASSSGTTLTYYRSNDPILNTSSDTSVGTDGVASLIANASGSENINLVAPSEPGEYYYYACVSAVNNEADTSNNCSTGVIVNVASTVDLVVESPSVNDNILDSSQVFTFSTSVKNTGNSSSNPSTLIYYRSTNATITTSDTSVGSDSVTSLAANASAPETINLTAPSSPGNYFYGACVNAVNGESNSNNNCSAGVLVTVMLGIAPDAYEPNNDSTTATGISNGETQNHSIHEAGDQDWLTFTLPSPAQNLVVETGGTSGDDTQVRLYDSNLTELAFSDDAGGTRHSKVVLGAAQPVGTYYILVNDFGNDDTIENYTISVSFDSDEAPDESVCVPIKSANGSVAIICL